MISDLLDIRWSGDATDRMCCATAIDGRRPVLPVDVTSFID